MEKRLISGMKNDGRINGLKWVLVATLCFLFSCQKQRAPEGILTQPEMVKVLMEVYLDEEKVNRIGLTRDSAEGVFDSLKVRTFVKLNLTDSVFMRSMNYYTDRPKEMEMIYSALVDSLQLREQRTPSIEMAK